MKIKRKDDKDRVIMWFMSTMIGLRFSDVVRLSPEHIKPIMVRGQQRFYVDIIQDKSDYLAEIPLNKTAMEILESAKERNPDWKTKFFRVETNGNDLDRISVANDLKDENGIPSHLTCKSSRLSYSEMLQNVTSRTLYVDALLGHKLKNDDILRANCTVADFHRFPEVYFELIDQLSFLD